MTQNHPDFYLQDLCLPAFLSKLDLEFLCLALLKNHLLSLAVVH